jgi:hypothetical protein
MKILDMQPSRGRWWTREQVCSLKNMVIVLQTVNLHNIYDKVTGPLFTMVECVLKMTAEIAFNFTQYLRISSS